MTTAGTARPGGATAFRPTLAAVAATLGLAVVGCVVAVRQLSGMDMGTATELGSFPAFCVMWVSMTAAMMLPGATPAVLLYARADGRVRAVAWFVGGYLTVWAFAGPVVYALYRPHGSVAAGFIVVVAGLYALTPIKRHCRRRCRESAGTGAAYGLYCLGASGDLMLVLLAVGVMSIPWMGVVTVLVLVQKLAPARTALDRSLAVAVMGLGVLILVAPATVPGLMPAR